MSDVVPFRRSAAPAPRLYEDPLWAERHRAYVPAADAVPPPVAGPDCICKAGTVCRHNNACPRGTRSAATKPTLVGG